MYMKFEHSLKANDARGRRDQRANGGGGEHRGLGVLNARKRHIARADAGSIGPSALDRENTDPQTQ